MKNLNINIKNCFIFELLVLMTAVVLTDWIVAIVRGGTFTIFGLVVNFLEVFIAAICYDYLEQFYETKQSKKNK